MKTIGQKIKERRKELKITLEELAKKVDSTKSYMWEIEKKENARPSADKLSKIALALSLPISYLLDENQEEVKFNQAEELFMAEYRKLSELKKEQLFKIMKVL